MIKSLRNLWKKGWISAFIISMAFLYFFKLSWLSWGDIIIDTGRELYIPFLITKGKILYRDISYPYGPFSAYFNAVFYKIFGVQISSLVICGCLTITISTFLIYKICRIFLNIFLSTLVALTFVIIFAFGHYVYYNNYNYILPYSYASIHAVMFSLAGIYSLHKIMNGGSKSHKTISYCLFCLAMLGIYLTRIEIALMLSSSLLVSITFGSHFRKEEPLLELKDIAILIGLPLACAVFIYGFFITLAYSQITQTNLWDVLYSNLSGSNTFTLKHSGFISPKEKLYAIINSGLVYFIFFIICGTSGKIIEFVKINKNKLTIFALFIAGFSLSWVITLFLFKEIQFLYKLQYRILPFICLITFFLMLKNNPLLAIISFFSFLLTCRNILFAGPWHYGFYLLVPGLLVFYIFLWNIAARLWHSKLSIAFVTYGFVLLSLCFSTGHVKLMHLYYQHKTLTVSSPRGTLHCSGTKREYYCFEFINYMRRISSKDETLVVFPEGIMLNFLSNRDNPLYYYSYLPVELKKKHIRDKIIRDLEDMQISYIAVVQRDTSEYGPRMFGRDYAQDIKAFILLNYTLVKKFGTVPFIDGDFGIALFKKKL